MVWVGEGRGVEMESERGHCGGEMWGRALRLSIVVRRQPLERATHDATCGEVAARGMGGGHSTRKMNTYTEFYSE